MKNYDFIIVGGGCAGMGFFLQVLKDFEKVLLLEQKRIGGDICYAYSITNFPGFCDINGSILCSHFEKQLKSYKDKIRFEKCTVIQGKENCVLIKTEKNIYRSKYCIVATGRKEKSIKKYQKFNLKNRFDQIKGRRICVIGGGEVALDQSLSLIKKRKRVTIISKGNFNKVNKKLIDEVKRLNRDIFPFSKILNIEKMDDKYKICFKSKNEYYEKVFEDILICIGSNKNLPQIIGKNKRIFFCGSVKGKNFKQGSISFADGIKLAMKFSSERRKK